MGNISIPYIVEQEKCCGCELCLEICKVNAISLYKDAEGFKYPKIDATACVECGRCQKYCPIYSSIESCKEDLKQAYAGYIKDKEELGKVASGGIASALSRNVLLDGGIVYGVSWTEDLYSAKYIRVDNLKTLDQLKGSKYIQAEKHSSKLYLQIKQDVTNKKKILFIGLPCEVAAVKKMILNDRLDADIVFCDLFCHGPTSQVLQESWIKRLEKKYKNKIIEYSVKYKGMGWETPYLYAKFKDNSSYCKRFYDTEFGYGFQYLARNSCYNCLYKIGNSVADISIGDYWGIEKNSKIYNENGVSAIIVHTKRGEDMLASLGSMMNMIPAEYEHIIKNNPNILNSIKNDGREKYSKKFKVKGAFIPYKRTIKNVIKNIFIYSST